MHEIQPGALGNETRPTMERRTISPDHGAQDNLARPWSAGQSRPTMERSIILEDELGG